MKKIFLLISVLCILMFNACSEKTLESESKTNIIKNEIDVENKYGEDGFTDENDNNIFQETELEEIKKIYLSMDDFVTNFIKFGLETSEKRMEFEDTNAIYNKVAYKNISSLKDLKKVLKENFSEKCVENIINISAVDKYREVEDELYQIDKEQELKVNGYVPKITNVCVNKISDDKYEIHVKKILKADDEKVYDFLYIYEHVSEKWIFTEFPIVSPFMIKDELVENDDLRKSALIDMSNLSDVNNFFDESAIMYSMFSSTRHQFLSNDQITLGDSTYTRSNGYIKSMKELKSYLEIYFSEDIIEGLFKFTNDYMFIEIDDILYANTSFFPYSNLTKIDGQIEELTEDKCVFVVYFKKFVVGEDSDNPEIISKNYTLEKINMYWIFTQYPSPLSDR